MTIQDSCTQKHNNQLVNETSPYLLQHAHNPVDWYPYGDEAFEKAKKDNKLMLFSIGYAACHWCHVMEHESFENEAVAEIMNQHFICVKVDREERPDVDQIYMNAVQLLTGSGGWPLNCFALPDGRPVWGGTYFRPKDWTNILESLASAYKNDPQKFEHTAQELTRGITQSELIQNKSKTPIFSSQDIEESVNNLKQRFDYQNGGFVGQPKFPMPGIYDMLLDYALTQNDEALLNHISFTLKKWAYGGIYDQLGGGFARYSVDSQWLVPHFEKMLYDNGQIIGLYAKAYRVSKEPVFKRIIEESIQWLENDMTKKDGLFFASYDADSEGEEGLFYVWKKNEIEKHLNNDADDFIKYYGISNSGNFEGSNILNVTSLEESNEKIAEQKKVLFKIREDRIKPGLDDKTLSSWNALAISGLCESYWALQNPHHLNLALKAAKKIKSQNINKQGELLRLFKKNGSVKGFLDDYSLVIKAFLDLYEATSDDEWLETAILLQKKANELFLDNNSGMYYYTALGENVVVRKMETTDNVIPASNAVIAHNLLRLSVLTEDETLREHALQMGRNVISIVKQSPSYAYLWLSLYQKFNADKKEIVIVGKDASSQALEINKEYHPNTVVIASEKQNEDWPLLKNRWKEDKTLFYYCVNNSCQMPTEKMEDLLKLIK